MGSGSKDLKLLGRRMMYGSRIHAAEGILPLESRANARGRPISQALSTAFDEGLVQ